MVTDHSKDECHSFQTRAFSSLSSLVWYATIWFLLFPTLCRYRWRSLQGGNHWFGAAGSQGHSRRYCTVTVSAGWTKATSSPPWASSESTMC